MAEKILEVPKIKQCYDYNCGPVCLTIVVNYYSHNLTQQEISANWGDKEYYSKSGVYVSELLSFARNLGLIAYSKQNMDFSGIRKIIDSEIPLMTRIQDKEYGWSHLVVVKGYKTEPNRVIINDPDDLRRTYYLYSEFAKKWNIRRKYAGTKNLGIIIREEIHKDIN